MRNPAALMVSLSALAFFAIPQTSSADPLDQPIAKARAATEKTVREAKGLSHPSPSKHSTLKLASGDNDSIDINEDYVVLEGSTDRSAPPSKTPKVNVNATNCVIRNIQCAELELDNGAKATIVDSKIGSVNFTKSRTGEDARKTKCEFIAGNCVINSATLYGPLDYEIMVRDKDGGFHTDTMKISGTGVDFKFKNCSFINGSVFTLKGDVELDFSNCLFATNQDFYDIDRDKGGKCSFKFNDCALFFSQGARVDKLDFINKIRKDAGQANARGKTVFLESSPFAKSSDAASAGARIDESSPAFQMQAGAYIGENGMPDPEKQLAAFSKSPSSPVKPPLKKPEANDTDNDAKKTEKELEEGLKKLENPGGKQP